MTEKVEVVIIGAGLAGLGAAYHLAAAGREVLVVERGDYPGSKNVSGGRMYVNPLRAYYPELLTSPGLSEVPFERPVIKERLTMLAPESATTVEHGASVFSDPQPQCYSVLRSVFDRWLADQVSARGAMIIPGYNVDDLVIEDDRLRGIVSGGEAIHANVVLAADGALSFIAEKAGLRRRHHPAHFALGFKQIVELPADEIEKRFGLLPGQGAAQLFFGAITRGMTGGGFLYTNRESISIGLVLGMGSMVENGSRFDAPELFEAFLRRPEILPLIAGGNVVEYSAHAIPEAGPFQMKALHRDGMLVAGDAAGLALNMGMIVRGMDFALASGALAAETIDLACKTGDFSSAALAGYQRALESSFVFKDHKTFAAMPSFLENERLYQVYPGFVGELFNDLFMIPDGPKPAFRKTLFSAMRRAPLGGMLRDLLKIRRL